jgi:hypothetical protein
MPNEHLTPMSTLIRAFQEFADNPSLVGKVAECIKGDIFYREQVDYCNESQRWMGEESGQIWQAAYNL